MNRDRLLTREIELVGEMQNNYIAPTPPIAKLADWELYKKMEKFMTEGIEKGDFMPHDRTVAMTIAEVMLRANGDPENVDEQALYARERVPSSHWQKPVKRMPGSARCLTTALLSAIRHTYQARPGKRAVYSQSGSIVASASGPFNIFAASLSTSGRQ